MSRFSNFTHNWQDYLILVVAVLVSLSLIFFGNEQSHNGKVQALAIEMMGRIASPVWKARQYFNIMDTNRDLRRENALLQLYNAQLNEAFHENQRLRKLLGLGLMQEYDCIPAKVLGRQQTGIHTIILSAGLEQNVRPNMPVVSANGLVGKISQSGPNYSSAQLLIDRNFRVAVRVQRSRVEGIFKWQEGTVGVLESVHHRADVQGGDIVITSGMSSLFPPGLLIGRVIKVESVSTGLFQDITVQALVDFDRLEEVFIVKQNQPIPMNIQNESND